MEASAKNKVPPLIDREIFFGNPEISGGQISPDGQYISFIKPFQGVRNIWVKKTAEPFEAARPITADTNRPIPVYFWSHDSKYILYVQDKGGNEDYHVYAVDPMSESNGDNSVPEARNLTPIDGVRALIYRVPKSDPDLMYVGLNDRDKAWHDLYKLKISTGELSLLRENTEQIAGWGFDIQDQIRLAYRTTGDGSREILRVEEKEFVSCYSCTVEETCYVLRFHKNGEQAYLVSNKGGDLDLMALMLLDPLTGKTTLVETDPEDEVDFEGAYFSKVTEELVVTTFTGDKTRYYFKDNAFAEDFAFLKKQLKGSDVKLVSTTTDEQLWVVYANSDVNPGSAYLFDRANKKLTFQYQPRPKLPTEYLAHMEPVRYPSTDGLEIPAYLTLPREVVPEKLPTILLPHGGPWARDEWGYNAYAQFWANRGYAVLQPNFRSSTGYGKKFLNAGNGEWGEAMQDDLTAGVNYLVKRGIADVNRVAIMGGSYGGYATLAGLTFTPDIYAAGVSVVGPSNLITLLDSIPPYWEAGRKMFHKRMGDPTNEAGKAKLIAQSPLFHAKNIRAPLLVVQGANDPRVKKAESDQIVVAMRQLGLPVEYIVAPDEGHGFSRPVNQMAFIAAAEKFLAKHIGGRFQEEMRKETAQRLGEITVDINSVDMPETVNL